MVTLRRGREEEACGERQDHANRDDNPRDADRRCQNSVQACKTAAKNGAPTSRFLYPSTPDVLTAGAWLPGAAGRARLPGATGRSRLPGATGRARLPGATGRARCAARLVTGLFVPEVGAGDTPA